MSTRWSNPGFPSSIQLDLGAQKTICSVTIAWYRGDERQNTFKISISKDDSSYTNVFSGKSSGTTTAGEKYDFVDSEARYVKITVTDNSQSNWASITEIDVSGAESSGTNGGSGYHYDPSFSAKGSNFQDVSSSSSLQLSKFTVATWFKTTSNFDSKGYIVNKGGIGSDSSSKNMNHGIWMTSGGQIQAGFETSGGTDNFVTSSGKYNDGKWHYALVTFDGSAINLYVDNNKVSTLSTSSSPDKTGSQPVRVGANSLSANNFFTGSIDEVRIWNRALSSQERTDAFSGKFNTNGQLLFVPFSGSNTNSQPSASDQSISVNKNVAKALTLKGSDSDGDPLTYKIVSQPGHGTLTGTAPSVTYDPDLDFVGSDSFTFKVNDGKADSNIGTISLTITEPASAGTDKFGIKKIYDTKSSGEEWYMNMKNPTGDSRFNPQNTITKNSDGSWKMKSSKVRMGVYTSAGYDQDKIPTLDHSKLAQKGYMQSPKDWRDIEMTMYTKVNKAGSDDNFAPYGRGGRHTGGGSPEGCEGSAYKGDIFFSGKVRFAKEQWHVSYVFTDYNTATSSIKGKWIGFKFVMYNFQLAGNGETAVKMELWLDKKNDGIWTKVDENIDKGGWGNEGGECNGAPDQIITWGGPIATFRWDTATDVDFKNLSVREINP